MSKWLMIGDRTQGRDNHFNLIRILAATGVVVAHAFPLSRGSSEPLLLESVFGVNLGHISVLVFFAISGFFIAKSFDQGGSLYRFTLARVLRIFPGLFVMLLLTVLIAGVFLTTAPPREYWPSAVEYVMRNMTLGWLRPYLPGVFETNPGGATVNDPLWTLFHEVVCYFGLAAAGLLGLLRRGVVAAAAFALALALLLAAPYLALPVRIQAQADLSITFLLGAAAYVWRDRIPLTFWIPAVACGVALLANGTEMFKPPLYLAVASVSLWLGFARAPLLLNYNRLGDYSYGVYIYAYPIQQIIASSGVDSPLLNISMALPLALFCSVLSWRFVERPALKFKPASQRFALARPAA